MPGPIDVATVEIRPDTRSFTTQLQSQLNGAFRQVGRSVDASASQIGKSFQGVGQTAQTALVGVGRAGQTTFDSVAGTASREMASVERSVASATTRSSQSFAAFGLAAKAALLGIGFAATAGLAKLTSMGLKSAASLEQTRISFNALLGSADKGGETFAQLQQFAAQTPFEFPDIAAAAKRFLAFANSVGLTNNQLIPFLTTIGNVISVTGGGAESFGRITLAIGQIGSASKVTLDNLNQIADAIPGFSPIAAIADSLGISTAEAMKRVSAGTISAQQGIAALLTGMQKFPGAAGAMEKQSQTLLGVFSTFKDTVSQALAGAFEPAIPAIKNTLLQVTPILGTALGKIAPLLGQTLAAALPLIGNLIQAIVPILEPILAALGPALSTLGPALIPLGQALGQLLVPLAPLLPIVGQLAIILAQVLTPAIQVLAIVLKPLQPVLEFVGRAIGAFGQWLQSINWRAVGDQISGGFGKAWDAVSNFFVGIGHWFARLPGMVTRFIEDLPHILARMLKRAFDNLLFLVGVGIGLLIYNFTQFPLDVARAWLQLNAQVIPVIAGFFANLGVMVFHGIEDLVGFMQRLPSMIVTAIAELGPLLLHLIGNAFDRARTRAIEALVDIVNFVRDLPRKLIGFTAQVGADIGKFVISSLNYAIDKINAGLSKVDSFIPGDIPRLPRLAHGGIFSSAAVVGEDPRTAPEVAMPLGDPNARRILRDALGGGGPTVNIESLVVNVNGTMSASQARQAGEQVAAGIANAAAIRTAVRAA